MSIDERLLSVPGAPAPMEEEEYPENSADRAGLLRSQQRNGRIEDVDMNDWAAVRGQSRIRRAKELVAQKISSAAKSLSTMTSRWLVGAWRNLIPSYGFSFFYVYVHLFARNIFRSLFAPLGSEWFDRPGITAEQRDALGSKVKIIENMGVIIVSIQILLALLAAMAPALMIVYVVNNPENILQMPGLLFDAIKALLG